MRILTTCQGCGPELSVQTDPDQVPRDPATWADLVENLTDDTVPVSHDTDPGHTLQHEEL